MYLTSHFDVLVAIQSLRSVLGLDVKKRVGNALWRNIDHLVKNCNTNAEIF